MSNSKFINYYNSYIIYVNIAGCNTNESLNTLLFYQLIFMLIKFSNKTFLWTKQPWHLFNNLLNLTLKFSVLTQNMKRNVSSSCSNSQIFHNAIYYQKIGSFTSWIYVHFPGVVASYLTPYLSNSLIKTVKPLSHFKQWVWSLWFILKVSKENCLMRF